jgi:hypothetical protein
MPGFDRTGPRGQGALTGRGQGYCETGNIAGRSRFEWLGGFGRGWKNRFYATGIRGRSLFHGIREHEPHLTAEDRLKILNEEAGYYEKELNNIRTEIEQLNKRNEKTDMRK